LSSCWSREGAPHPSNSRRWLTLLFFLYAIHWCMLSFVLKNNSPTVFFWYKCKMFERVLVNFAKESTFYLPSPNMQHRVCQISLIDEWLCETSWKMNDYFVLLNSVPFKWCHHFWKFQKFLWHTY
jgi:hypothetical protein